MVDLGVSLLNGSFAALGGCLAAFVAVNVRLWFGDQFDTETVHPLVKRLVRFRYWHTRTETIVFATYAVLVSLAYPTLVVILLKPPGGYTLLFQFPVGIALGVVLGFVLALIGLATVAVRIVTPWEEDILGFTLQHLIVGVLVGLWITLTPIAWWPFLRFVG